MPPFGGRRVHLWVPLILLLYMHLCQGSPCLGQCRCYLGTLLCQQPDTIHNLSELHSLENFTEIVIENQPGLMNLTMEDMKNPRELKNLTIWKTNLQFVSPDAFRASPNLTHVE